ncbi:hypothetical protein ACIREO_37415 [Streptomyces sp. NPDC102441]|uniref:hypothetical protein n=1 Tax=Streptomyces sp. NPDC102441 TaxID=3366176 RepID=UPI00380C4091
MSHIESDPDNGTEATSGAGLAEADPPVSWRAVAQAMVFPLFFVLMFSLCYISAFHHPTPHNAVVTLVGPQAQTEATAKSIEASSGDMFDIRTSESLAGPLKALEERDQIGAIQLGRTLTVHTASAGGQATSTVVQRLGQQLGDASGLKVTVNDHVPLPEGDSTGTAAFYFLIICTLGGYLTITVLSQVAPTMSVPKQLIPLAVLSALTPCIVLAIGGWVIGAYSGTAAGIAATIAIGAVYAFTIGVVAILFNLLFKQAAIFFVMTVAVFLNFPSSGGAIAAPMLPAFWSFLNTFWLGAGAMDSVHAVLYFNGAGVGRGLLIIGCWLLVAMAGILLFKGRARRIASTKPPTVAVSVV